MELGAQVLVFMELLLLYISLVDTGIFFIFFLNAASLIIDSCDQSSASPLMEDIIAFEILPRLHVKALFRFKCISKRYESIISNPKFARKYLQLAHSSPESSSSLGLFPSLLFPFVFLSHKHPFTNKVKDMTDIINNGLQYPDNELSSICVSTVPPPFDYERHEILGSSGGLLLSCILLDKSSAFGRFSLCVCNPLTKQCIQLPNSTITTRAGCEVFGFATRWDHAAASLTYKVVIVAFKPWPRTTIEVFSSDTGNWVAREVTPPQVFNEERTRKAGFSYKGIMHWLDREEWTVITYDPYDNPGQYGRIWLPEDKYSSTLLGGCKRNKHKSLIYSGEEEKLKYCEILSEPDGDRLMVWELEDYDRGKWRLEGEFSVPCLLYACKRLMVAPYPWNRNVICHPYVRSKSITMINPWAGTRELVDIFTRRQNALSNKAVTYGSKFHLAELCPWSSPFYASSAS